MTSSTWHMASALIVRVCLFKVGTMGGLSAEQQALQLQLQNEIFLLQVITNLLSIGP